MGKHKHEKVLFKVIITLIAVIGIVYVGIAYHLNDRYLYGTRIGVVNASFLTTEEVKEKLLSSLDDYELTIEAKDGTTGVLRGDDIDLVYHFDDQLKEILKNQDSLGWLPAMLRKPVHFELTPEITYDEEKLEKCLNQISFLKKSNMAAPFNAVISYSEENGFVIQHSEEGSTVDMKRFKEALTNAISSQDTTLDLAASDCYEKPEVTEDSPEIREITEELDKVSDFEITYAFGETKEVIDKDVIWTWYRRNADGQLVLDEDAIKDYVKKLAEKYDTVGGTRSFCATDGRTIEVSGGPYGWKIDQKKESSALIDLVKNHRSVSDREPEYSHKGFENVRGTSDIGDSYIEVSIDAQHMWYYENGKLFMDTDVVTGKGGNYTKRGVGYIYNKARNATLVGEDYVSFVKYWMKVWGGIGIHDASWRSKFGGKIYLTNGSHGCINTPLENVIKLYNEVKIGTPVVIY